MNLNLENSLQNLQFTSDLNSFVDNKQKKSAITLEYNLIQAINTKKDKCFINNINHKAAKVHKVMLKEKENVFMFANGMLKGIFDNEEVIDAIEYNVVNTKLDPKESIIKLVCKQTKDKISSNLNSLDFYKKIQDLSKDYNRRILDVFFVNNQKITPPYCVDFRKGWLSGIVDKLNMKENTKMHKIDDILTFTLFDDCVRFRLDSKSKHDSEAVVNCGLGKEFIGKANGVANYLLENSVRDKELSV
jgi:hypothetical protein